MLGKNAIETVLGLEGPVPTDPETLARELTVTVFPDGQQSASQRERAFARRLTDALEELGVTIAPYEECLEPPPWRRWLSWLGTSLANALGDPSSVLGTDGRTGEGGGVPGPAVLKDMRWGSKLEPGTTVLAVGEGEAGHLPVDHVGDFRDATILTILEKPGNVTPDIPFTEHYETALELFAQHMTNVVVGVGREQWFVYNFNGSHPFYDVDEPLSGPLRRGLVPKLAAPIRPPRLSDLEVREEAFDPTDAEHRPIVEDLVDAGDALERTGLYPEGTDLDELPWHNRFYRWAGKLHLDDRNGMSYGFLARQMPTPTVEALPLEDAGDVQDPPPPTVGHVDDRDGHLGATLDTPEGALAMPIPPVSVMTLRSGCDKTNPDPERDLVKLGLEHGRTIMETPTGTRVEDGYRPSFDTRVILAHALGNALVASLLATLRNDPPFARHLEDAGMALAHWHGYPNPAHLPEGYHVHGADKPHVSCGTPQAAIYALQGKLEAARRAIEDEAPFQGDVHVEPQHGTNLTAPTLARAANLLGSREDAAGLGNRYLDAYTSRRGLTVEP